MALDVFSTLSQSLFHADFTYIGIIPSDIRHSYANILSRLDYHPCLPRLDVLAIFEKSHILFHPSRFESLATVLVEAMAMGMAVVVACGGDMADTPELFGDGGALFVDRDNVPATAEAQVFEEHLKYLLSDREHARSLALRNYELASNGWLSIRARDSIMKNAYEEAIDNPADSGLEIPELPYGGGCKELRLPTKEIMAAEDAFRGRIGLSERRLIV